MKLSTLFLAGSLAINVALVGIIAVGTTDNSGLAAPHGAKAAAPANTATASATSATVAGDDPAAWTELSTGDLPAQIARLRAAGFPPTIVRAIVAAQINEGFAARRKALNAGQNDAPYWKNPASDPKIATALRDLSREQQKALTDLLGSTPLADDPARAASLRQQFGNLPDDKLEQLQRIQQDYNDRQSALLEALGAGSGPIALADDTAQKLNALRADMHTAFAGVLTPDELANYDMRSSTTARSLQNRLTAFDPTEPEYETIFQLQQRFDNQWNGQIGPLTSDQAKARNDAQTQLNLDIKTALGDARYADYQRSNDANYRTTTQLVARLDLPADTANQVYAVQQDIQQRARAVQTDRTLAPDDRTQQLGTLAAEAQAKVTAVLGATGFEAYKQYGGSWLQNLQPRPTISQPTPPASQGVLILGR